MKLTILQPPGVTENTSSSAGILSSDSGDSNNVMANDASCWPLPVGVADCCCCCCIEYHGESNRLLKASVLATPPEVLLLTVVDSTFVGTFCEIC